ncbi:acetylpolyamine amidohydrolase [Siccirubricoccus deserti]|uniref:Histone deacetylase family protein n=1 Tax=Siccirubricoccus deserti TaxID=2013562 RepID=A0A9X0QX73_9PROT|nr:histone deacetylase family protein [Siccirubricoccus deserti]MBC4015484.1 histone deacetylase family protein [Siccirubricoccus deserti]GGC42067.1 acetylpolyamine amidohydrolase [Siccirubricoccus deserti]
MRAFHHPDQQRHQPRFFLIRGQVRPNFEVPARAEALLSGLATLGITPEVAPAPDRAALEAVHAPDYLAYLEGAASAWAALPDAGPEVVANMHATADALANGARRPQGIIGQAAWYSADNACPIGPGTWEASRAAAGVALAAAAEASAGRSAYALCRPPGHHAYRARAGGHCYLNNAAIAAAALQRAGAKRVATIDIDSHHGNGTQGLFWESDAVFTFSVHGDPHRYYPFFTGHAEERGGGPGTGLNLNAPLAFGTGDAGWLAAITDGAAAARRFGAEALVVSLGFDASEHEPLNALAVTADGFARAGALLRGLGLPTAIIQEGGYNVDWLGRLLERFLTGWGEA